MPEALRSRLHNTSDELIGLGFALAELVLVVGLVHLLNQWLRGPVRRRLDHAGIAENGKVLIQNGVTVVVGLTGLTLLLALWGVTWSGLLTTISFSTVAIILGLQDVLKSFVGGVFIVFERPYSVGDRIKVRDVSGEVVDIDLRTTILRSDTGQRISAPNSIVFTDTVTNLSSTRSVRTLVTIGGVEGTPAELRASVLAALADVPGLPPTPDVTVLRGRPRPTVPASLAGLPTLGRSGRVKARSLAPAAQVRVSWLGSGEAEVQEEVVQRLQRRFPTARVVARRR